MTAMRWLGFALVVIVAGTRIAEGAIAMNPEPVDAGPVLIGPTGASVLGTLSSTSNVNVDIALTTTCTGTGTGTFTLSTAAGLTNVAITNGNPVDVTVKYVAATRGLKNCNVDVLDATTKAVLYTFHVQGTGVAPVVSAPASLTFADARWNDFAAVSFTTQALTITNSSNDTGQNLMITSFAISGTDAADFSITGPSTASITPQGSAMWTVTMNPSAAGPRSATLTINTNDPVTPMKTVALGGTGLNAVIAVTDVTFPQPLLGTLTAATGNVTVANTAASNVGILTATSATISSTSSWFSFGTGNGCTLGTTACTLTSFTMGASKTIPVRCLPPAGESGSQTATVTVTSDSDTGGDNVATLTCTVAPRATANPTSIDFGNIEVGKTSGNTMLTVTNSGGAPLNITSAGLAVAGAADYSVASGVTGAQTLGAGMSATWEINCHPTTHGPRPGTFAIVSNSDNVASSTLNVPLACNGQRAVLVITPSSYNFGGVREFFSVAQSFTLSNAGNVPVTNITAMLDAKLLGFSLTTPPPTSLAGGAQATVTVTFAPQSGTDGCVIAAAGDCTIRFSGDWGVTPTITTATLTVLGDGLTTGYDTSPASPNALEFGDVRYDQTKTMQVSVINTAGTSLQIRGATITPNTSQTNEFYVSGCTRNGNPITCPTVSLPYTSVGINDTIVFNVVCDPNNRVAMFDAMFTVTSDLAQNPNRTVPLKCNSTSAMLGINPSTMVLDFGPTDLDAVPVSVTRTITVMNTGTGPLTLGAGSKTGVFYVASAMPAQTVQPNGMISVNVTYTPTIERPSNTPDTGTIVIPLSGVLGGPASLTIALTGYGVDRHIGVGAAPVFPDTFKNPGDQAPVMPVRIMNNGDAALNVSAVMLSGDPIWTLVNPDPVTVQGRQSHDFSVKFSPTMSGKAPVGRLTIINNDNGMPMVSVDVNGNGLDRNVTMGPPVIDVGYVGIGTSARLSELELVSNAPPDLLRVTSADSVNSFMIATIRVEGGEGAFAIEDNNGNAPAALPLGPSGLQAFDVVFTPTTEGEFLASGYLLLDQDPEPQAVVMLRGRGLYVDAAGGGGCSTTGTSGAAMILVIAGLLFARRRRGQGVVVVAGVVGLIGVSRAEDTRNLALTVFDPTPATVGQTFQLQSATVGADGDYVLSAFASYANKPLVLYSLQNNDAAITNRTTLALGGAYAFADRYEVGAHVPLFMQSGEPIGNRTEMLTVPPASGASRGDVTLHGKLQLGASTSGLTYGFGAALTLPTASDEQFAGTEKPSGRGLFLLSFVRGPVTTHLNVGGVVRAKSEFYNVTQGSGGVWGAGLAFRVANKIWVDGEIFGELIPGGKTPKTEAGEPMGDPKTLNTIEALAGMHVQVARTTTFGLALGRGVTRALGSPAFRGALTLTITPNAAELKPLRPPRPPAPPKDSDRDGMKDEDDACPDEAEDKDMFDDSDGCPDADNDRDGFADAVDKCPLDAEDKDGFEDTNGCPERDNDFDGIDDTKDKCPVAAEDRDGFQDTDGCPEPDNDGDGLIDTVDKCPKEAETINGNADDDGCPDRGDSFVVLNPDRLEILESVQFSGRDQIARSSRNVLGQLGATLRAHPEILRVRITAHINPTGNAAADQKLSEQRAKAVKDWLTEWGIDPLRLQSSGFGSTKPLVPASQRGADQINTRVEFIILERK